MHWRRTDVQRSAANKSCGAGSIHIVSDDGSENKGDVLSWVSTISSANFKKLIAGKDLPFSNSMSESTHHLFKTFFAPGKIYTDDEHLQKELEAFVQFANFNWFPLEFYGLSPIEVLENGVVDRKRFTEQIKLAQKQRVIENKKFRYCLSCN